MQATLRGRLFVLTGVLGFSAALWAADPPQPDLAEYKTVATASTTVIVRGKGVSTGLPAYLGIVAANEPAGRLKLADVERDSPAAQAGLKRGDLLTSFEGKAVPNSEALRSLLQAHAPGDSVKLAIIREGEPKKVVAALAAVSRPMKISSERAFLGLQVGEPKEDDGAPIERITEGSPAARAGLKAGDLLLKLDGAVLTGGAARLRDALSEKRPGDAVKLTYRRGEEVLDVRVELTAEQGFGRRGFGGQGWDSREATIWKKNTYRLAVVCIEFPDVKHNEKIECKDWENALFSQKTYKTSATGQTTYGSLHDYYQELSCGALRIEGKVFPWVCAGKNRGEYAQNSGRSRTTLLIEAVGKVLERDGKDALQGFDGLFFLYAGTRVQTNRGGLYWPHCANMTHEGKRWRYFICPEGGSRMANNSVICHEFGHMLGLPDLYARPENPGSEGAGVWCAMSNQSPNGRPQHFCAWAKEQLGWLKPAVIDPTVPQKLILSPVENSASECFKVLVRRDGSEYFLLENRRRIGYDQSLAGEGLLIWRVVGNKPILEESHGVEGPPGPGVFPRSVPYPSDANNAFTPYTLPSSRSQLGGGTPVHITNIRRLADGRITLSVGYEYQ